MSRVAAIDLQGTVALDAAWQRSPQIVVEELLAATWEVELLVQREVQDATPIGVGGAGGLKGSIGAQEPQVLGNTVIGVVGTSLAYAEPVELGTKPHWAPIAPIEDWVRHKLGISAEEAEGVARRIQFKIAHRGTQGAHMFQRGFDRSRAFAARRYSLARDRIIKRLGGG